VKLKEALKEVRERSGCLLETGRKEKWRKSSRGSAVSFAGGKGKSGTIGAFGEGAWEKDLSEADSE